MSSPRHQRELRLPPQAAGRRLDQALADALPEFSRSRLKRWIDAGSCPSTAACRGRATSSRAESASCSMRRTRTRSRRWRRTSRSRSPGRTATCIVVDKPAGLVVHPGAGNPASTLQNALLAHDPKLAKLPRAGIVHRLDKDTTGLLIVARNEAARDVARRRRSRRAASSANTRRSASA